jgi:pimeloyl-ACP methyl ester carboxylesterase
MQANQEHSTSVRTVAWPALAVSTLAALGANLAVLLMPHARGVGFFPQLRFAVVTSACVLLGATAALTHRHLAATVARPRGTLSATITGLAALLLLGMAVFGPRGLAAAAAAPVLCASIITAGLLPRLFDARRRSRIAVGGIALLAALELLGSARGFASERVGTAGSDGPVFEVPRTLFDVEQRFVELPSGARVHYVDEGRGRTLLFLHGNPSWSFQWRELIYGLRGSYRCVALDYPGFGMSTAPPGFGYTPREQSQAVEEFVDRLALRDITLVMQDWGGPIGVDFAGRRPGLVRALVLGNTWAWQTSTDEARGKWSLVAGGPIGEFVQMNFNGVDSFVVSFDIAHSTDRPLPVEVLDLYARPFRPLDRRGVVTLYPQLITVAKDYFVEIEQTLPRLADRRALLFWGLQDPGFPRSDLERWERLLPNHEVVELPNGHHFFFEGTSDQVIARIQAFASD